MISKLNKYKKNTKTIPMKKRIVFFILAIILSINFMLFSPTINPVYNEPVEVVRCNSVNAIFSIKEFFKNLFSKNKEESDYNAVEVYLGGNPLGFTISCQGVIVVAISNVITPSGTMSPTSNSDIKEGDIIKKINDKYIMSASDIELIINDENIKGKDVNVEILRGDKTINTTISPKLDNMSNTYKLGLWIRDNAAGVGTLTYIRADNNRFGALGHPVCDIDTGSVMKISSGKIFNCNIVGVNKGKRGAPGELRGMFLKSGKEIGILEKNTNVGVFGVFTGNTEKFTQNKKVKTASKNQVKTGKAQIYCTINSTTPKFYDIEIVKLNYQSQNKNMVVRVVDKELLESTGGIVQGMSGSPIIQGGKLIGAMTHVFVNDPTKGFAVYIDCMINN